MFEGAHPKDIHSIIMGLKMIFEHCFLMKYLNLPIEANDFDVGAIPSHYVLDLSTIPGELG